MHMEQVEKYPEQQPDDAHEDYDSDMLVAEDEENYGADPVKLHNAVSGYVDPRGIFREY